MKTISAALLAAPVFAGWNIISQSSDNACHILENGCIADDEVGTLNQNYANDEHCTFEYTGTARISFSGNINGKGSHFHTESGWDFMRVINSGPDLLLSGDAANDLYYIDVVNTQRFKFTSDESFTRGGFKVCDDKTYTADPTKAPTKAPTKNPTKAPTAACVPGQSGQGEGDCQDCGIGTYSTTYNAPTCEPCLAHPTNGAWTHAAGQSDANCPWGCADGHSPTHGGTKCDAEGATLSLKAGSKTALFTMHKNGALKLSGGDDICIEAPNCATSGSTSADSHERRLGDMGAEISTRFDALEARMAALEAR